MTVLPLMENMTGSERFRREGEFKQRGLGQNRMQVTVGEGGVMENVSERECCGVSGREIRLRARRSNGDCMNETGRWQDYRSGVSGWRRLRGTMDLGVVLEPPGRWKIAGSFLIRFQTNCGDRNRFPAVSDGSTCNDCLCVQRPVLFKQSKSLFFFVCLQQLKDDNFSN